MLETPAQAAVAARFDAITAEQLRDVGSLKWTGFAQLLPAWVAEMDFGLAPPIAKAVQNAVAQGLTGYLPTGLVDAMGAACSDFLLTRHG